MQAPYTLTAEAGAGRTLVFDMNRLPWQATANPGLWLKPVRHDDARGLYLGLVKFDVGTRSGLHQHQAVASSFVVDGGLTDYHGSLRLHQAGINVKGSTHDAISYQQTVLASRLEGPVLYPPAGDISGVHAGSRHGSFQNADPDVPPEINVEVDALAYQATGFAGVRRQTVFDYVGTGTAHRMVQLTLRPTSAIEFRVKALTEFWVRGGGVQVCGDMAQANSFVVCEPGARVKMDSAFGALLIGWAEAREESAGDLFGY